MFLSQSYKRFYEYDINEEYRYLGNFTQESSEIIVCDPACEYKLAHVNVLNEANDILVFYQIMRGNWNVWSRYLTDDDGDCYSAMPVCELTTVCCPNSLNASQNTKYHFFHNEWEDYASICVVSSQVGIYDSKYYRDDNNLTNCKIWKKHKIKEKGDKWFAANCYMSRNKYHAGVINNGCVVTPCYGNRIYDVEILKFEGKIVGIRMIFDMDSETNSNETDDYSSDE